MTVANVTVEEKLSKRVGLDNRTRKLLTRHQATRRPAAEAQSAKATALRNRGWESRPDRRSNSGPPAEQDASAKSAPSDF